MIDIYISVRQSNYMHGGAWAYEIVSDLDPRVLREERIITIDEDEVFLGKRALDAAFKHVPEHCEVRVHLDEPYTASDLANTVWGKNVPGFRSIRDRIRKFRRFEFSYYDKLTDHPGMQRVANRNDALIESFLLSREFSSYDE